MDVVSRKCDTYQHLGAYIGCARGPGMTIGSGLLLLDILQPKLCPFFCAKVSHVRRTIPLNSARYRLRVMAFTGCKARSYQPAHSGMTTIFHEAMHQSEALVLCSHSLRLADTPLASGFGFDGPALRSLDLNESALTPNFMCPTATGMHGYIAGVDEPPNLTSLSTNIFYPHGTLVGTPVGTSYMKSNGTGRSFLAAGNHEASLEEDHSVANPTLFPYAPAPNPQQPIEGSCPMHGGSVNHSGTMVVSLDTGRTRSGQDMEVGQCVF
jgi:hypothetical protein